jgi:ribosomal protein L37AE/L43A
MANFTGTKTELHRHLGSRFTNLVQKIARKHKTKTACQHCGGLANLEAAHVHGRSRPSIVNLVASEYTKDSVVSFNFVEFEKKFIAQHNPIEKTIIFLCRSCHQKYDNPAKTPSKSGDPFTQTTSNAELLPITLEPRGSENFREQLLKSKKAEIKIIYSDGSSKTQLWNASKLLPTSNIMGNLRSRPKFKAGQHQANGIVAVHVKVIT